MALDLIILVVRQFLTNHFQGRWIRRGGKIREPPHSPDLNPLDFFFSFWATLKKDILKGKSIMRKRSNKEFDSVIEQHTSNIPKEFKNRAILIVMNTYLTCFLAKQLFMSDQYGYRYLTMNV